MSETPARPSFGFEAISRSALIAIGIEVSAMGAGYLAQILLARVMGDAAYGRFAFVVSLVVLLLVPLQLGFDIGLLRFVSRYLARDDHARAAGFMRVAFALPLTLTGLFAATVAAIALALPAGAWPYATSVAAGMALLPCMVAASLLLHGARAYGRFLLVKAIQDIGRPLLLIAGVGLALFAGGSLSAPMVLLISSAGTLLLVAIQGRYLLRLVRATLAHAVVPRYELRAWLTTCLPFLLTAGTAVIMQHSDVLMIGLYRDAADVGVYAVAAKLSKLVTLTLVGVNMMAAPAYAALFAQSDRAGMQALVYRLAHYVFWPALVVALALALTGQWLLGWFGPAFSAGYPALMILVLAGLVDVGVGSVGYLANMTDLQWPAARIRGLSALANIALNALLIPLFGMLGAAIATALSIALANIWLYRLIRRRIGLATTIVDALRRPVSGSRAC